MARKRDVRYIISHQLSDSGRVKTAPVPKLDVVRIVTDTITDDIERLEVGHSLTIRRVR